MSRLIWWLIAGKQDNCRFCKADLYNCAPCRGFCIGRLVN